MKNRYLNFNAINVFQVGFQEFLVKKRNSEIEYRLDAGCTLIVAAVASN